MELPDIGSHCSNKSCNRLDFLPYKCQYCDKKFCESHWKVQQHECSGAHKIMDVKVPVCPLCSAAIPVNRGEDPNYRIERHIRMGCPKVPGTTSSKPAYNNNRCKFQDCKVKGLVFVKCPDCSKDFCLKHRHQVDHSCTKVKPAPASSKLNIFSKPVPAPKKYPQPVPKGGKTIGSSGKEKNPRKLSSGCMVS